MLGLSGLSGERFSPLKEITADNVARLRRVCTFETGELVGFQTSPVVVGGVMYFTTFQNTYAIDAATGRQLWRFDTVVAAAGKDGYLYGIDPSGVNRAAGAAGRDGASAGKYGAGGPGALVVRYKAPTTTHLNTTTPLSTQRFTRFCPGSQGGTEWNGPAFSPALNLIYVPTNDWCTSVKLAPPQTLKGATGQPWTGSHDNSFGRQDPKERWRGWVTAVDADSGRVRWKYQSAAPVLSAVTATAGGLLFAANVNGEAFAFDARTGRVLWHDQLEPNAGGVVSYSAGGRQLVAFAPGMKSPIWPVEPKPARIVVYGLP